MPGQFAQGGVTMRDCSTNRAGFDRVLMAVAATFLTVSATSALAAQSTTPRASAAELAIDAAVPRPEPANVPPPTVGDFKMDTTATVPDAAKAVAKPNEPDATAKAAEPKTDAKPAETVTAPAANDAATATPPAATATAPAAEPAKEPVKVSTVAPADQPVADRLRDLVGAKSLRYFDRKNERAAVEKFYSARDYAPQWTQAGKLTDSGKGVIARLKDAASEGLNAADYPVPDFAAAASPDQLAEAELKLTASMLDYARQAQSGRMHWSQVSADIQYPEHPTDPAEVLANISTAKDASAALDGYNPPHKLYKELKAKLAELRGQGDGPMIHIAEGPALAYKAATKKLGEVAPEDPRVPQRRPGLDHEGGDRKTRTARHAASDGNDEVHHRQSDVERTALDYLQRISAGPAAGPDRAAAHGTEARAQPRRKHPYFATTGRGQCARPHPLQLPEQVPGLSARHPGQASVRPGRARLQPWLHAGTESGSIRLDAAQYRDAERALHAGKNPQHVRPQRDRPEIPDAAAGQHHLSDRFRGRRRQAADPQGRLWPRRRDGQFAQEQPQQGPGSHGCPCAAELFAPVRLEPAGRRQLRQRQHLFLRPLVLRAPVRRPVDRNAAGTGRPAPATAVHQVIR